MKNATNTRTSNRKMSQYGKDSSRDDLIFGKLWTMISHLEQARQSPQEQKKILRVISNFLRSTKLTLWDIEGTLLILWSSNQTPERPRSDKSKATRRYTRITSTRTQKRKRSS